MQAQIENLVKLQAVELERARLTQALRALPAEVAQADAALQGRPAHAADASDALSREETLRTRLEREIAGHRQKAARFRTQRDSVTTPAQADAIEHEITFAESAKSSALKTRSSPAWSALKPRKPRSPPPAPRLKTCAGALDKTRDRVALRQQELNAQLADAATPNAKPSARLIEPDLLARFDRLAGSRGTGLARAENQQCTGCRMGVRPQTWNQLREGELLTCDSCCRLLYWDPAMAPAQAPQPESTDRPPAVPNTSPRRR